MKTKEILNRTKEIFFENINIKTNWGKEQVKIIFQNAINEALMEAIDEKENN